jgi:hypothetical protein
MLRGNHAGAATLTPKPFNAISSAPLMRMQAALTGPIAQPCC